MFYFYRKNIFYEVDLIEIKIHELYYIVSMLYCCKKSINYMLGWKKSTNSREENLRNLNYPPSSPAI